MRKWNINWIAGNYDLDNANNFSSQGFPALDYLLYGIGLSDSEIIEKFNSGSGYKTYLKDIILKMVNNTNEVIDSWTLMGCFDPTKMSPILTENVSLRLFMNILYCIITLYI